MCTIVIAIAIATASQNALAWGKTGHRIIGEIAEQSVGARARAAVRRILGRESIAEAANWPDFERSNPDALWQKEAGPYHYVTVPAGKTYAEVGPPPEGDAVAALVKFAATVRDAKAPLADRQLALRFIIHIVGDLHQPFHVGNGTDKGGNDVDVTFFGRRTNLHAVWDTVIVDEEQLSYSEWARWLTARITPAQRKAWRDPNPLTWIAESTVLRDRIYPAVAPAPIPPPASVPAPAAAAPDVAKLGYDYVYA